MAQITQGNQLAVMVTKLGGEFSIPTCADKLPQMYFGLFYWINLAVTRRQAGLAELSHPMFTGVLAVLAVGAFFARRWG